MEDYQKQIEELKTEQKNAQEAHKKAIAAANKAIADAKNKTEVAGICLKHNEISI